MARRHGRSGRTTPKGTRPGHRQRQRQAAMPSPVELLLRDAAHMAGECDDLDQAEVWASAIQTAFRPSGLPPRPAADPREVLRDARRAANTAAAVLASAMAIYGPVSTRVKARQLADELAAGGVEVPGWVDQLGQVRPAGVAMLTDVWGDGCSIYLDCDRDGITMGVGVSIDGVGGGLASEFVYGPTVERLNDLARNDDHATVAPIEPAVARAMVEAALAERDESLIDDDADDGEDLRSLVEHRFMLLPEGGTAQSWHHELSEVQREAIIDEFLARNGNAELPDVGDIADTICNFAGDCDGDPLRWSPTRIEVFLCGWVPRKVIADDEWFRNLPPVLRAWLRYSAAARDLPDDALDINLGTVDNAVGLMQESRRDPAAWSPSTAIVNEMLADGVDPTNEIATQVWIDQYNARPRHERH